MICEGAFLRVLRPCGPPSTSSQLSDCGSMRPMAPWPRVAEVGGSLCSVHSGVTLPRKFTPPATSQRVSHCGFPRKAESPGLLPEHTSAWCHRAEQSLLGLLTRAQVGPVPAIPSDSMMHPGHLYAEAWRGEIGTHICSFPLVLISCSHLPIIPQDQKHSVLLPLSSRHWAWQSYPLGELPELSSPSGALQGGTGILFFKGNLGNPLSSH